MATITMPAIVGSQPLRRAALALGMLLSADAALQGAAAQLVDPIATRHLTTDREQATGFPRSEDDQALVDGWPLYRTRRGQEAFNAAMETLAVTRGLVPRSDAFARCIDLNCALALPALDQAGWLPPGRLWLSPQQYVVFVRSPRDTEFSRHSPRSMRYFVFHEFHNSTRNTDLFDTVSAHSGSVFVPFYLGKTGTDATGRQFVVLVQTAPFDVMSNHAANLGSAGPGVEVAKNASDALEPLQRDAGIILARIVLARAPHLEVVNHRGTEGLAMLRAYQARTPSTDRGARVALPFVAVPSDQRGRVRAASIGALIHRRDQGPPPAVAVAERSFLPAGLRRAVRLAEAQGGLAPDPARAHEPRLIGPMVPAPRRALRPMNGLN